MINAQAVAEVSQQLRSLERTKAKLVARLVTTSAGAHVQSTELRRQNADLLAELAEATQAARGAAGGGEAAATKPRPMTESAASGLLLLGTSGASSLRASWSPERAQGRSSWRGGLLDGRRAAGTAGSLHTQSSSKSSRPSTAAGSSGALAAGSGAGGLRSVASGVQRPQSAGDVAGDSNSYR